MAVFKSHSFSTLKTKKNCCILILILTLYSYFCTIASFPSALRLVNPHPLQCRYCIYSSSLFVSVLAIQNDVCSLISPLSSKGIVNCTEHHKLVEIKSAGN